MMPINRVGIHVKHSVNIIHQRSLLAGMAGCTYWVYDKLDLKPS